MFVTSRQSAASDDDGATASPHRAGIGKRVAGKLRRNPMVRAIGGGPVDLFLRLGFLNAAECLMLRAKIDAGAQPSALFSGSANPDYRTSDSCHLDPHDPQVKVVAERISALMGMPHGHAETIQGQRYRPGQEYRHHCDYFPTNVHYWPAMKAQGGQRCWTAMIYLSDVEAGGETVFPAADLAVPPREGALLMWNNLRKDGSPNPDMMHAAKPVEAGIKYVATQWYRERDWTPHLD